MSINRWMDKEAVVHIYNVIVLSHKKEHIWVSSKEVDEPRAYYTEWSKSEREKQILYTNAYVWNLEICYWWNYLQGSNEDRHRQQAYEHGSGVRKVSVGRMERVTRKLTFSSVQFSSFAQSCPTLCDPMNRSMPGLPVHHHLPEFTQIYVHRVSDATQPSHPLSSPSLAAPNPSQHQSLFQWVNSSHEVAKVLEFQL